MQRPRERDLTGNPSLTRVADTEEAIDAQKTPGSAGMRCSSSSRRIGGPARTPALLVDRPPVVRGHHGLTQARGQPEWGKHRLDRERGGNRVVGRSVAQRAGEALPVAEDLDVFEEGRPCCRPGAEVIRYTNSSFWQTVPGLDVRVVPTVPLVTHAGAHAVASEWAWHTAAAY